MKGISWVCIFHVGVFLCSYNLLTADCYCYDECLSKMCSLEAFKKPANKPFVFFRYHKAHLTRRLILDCSTDSDLEENMVEWLRVRLR